MSRLLDMNQEERNKILRMKAEFDWILRRLGDGLDILLCLNHFGCLEKRTLKRKMDEIYRMDPLDFHDAYIKCKGFRLIKSSTMNGKKTWWVDLTEKGLTVLNYYFRVLKGELKVNGSKG